MSLKDYFYRFRIFEDTIIERETVSNKMISSTGSSNKSYIFKIASRPLIRVIALERIEPDKFKQDFFNKFLLLLSLASIIFLKIND